MSEERELFERAWHDRMPHAAIWGEAVPYTQARIGRQYARDAQYTPPPKPRVDWGAVAWWFVAITFCAVVWLAVIALAWAVTHG